MVTAMVLFIAFWAAATRNACSCVMLYFPSAVQAALNSGVSQLPALIVLPVESVRNWELLSSMPIASRI